MFAKEKHCSCPKDLGVFLYLALKSDVLKVVVMGIPLLAELASMDYMNKIMLQMP